MSEYSDEHQLDVDTFEVARSIHRIVRAMHDGECPKCHTLFKSTAVVISDAPLAPAATDEMCPKCGFTITAAEQQEAMHLFAPVMERNLAVFENWRQKLRG